MDVRFEAHHARGALTYEPQQPDCDWRSAELSCERHPHGAGYLLKDRVIDIQDFGGDVRRVADGGLVIDRDVVAELVAGARTEQPLDRLTERERDVPRAARALIAHRCLRARPLPRRLP
jgi:hypothetical protein